MFNSIHTSAANRVVVTELTRRLALGPENVIARMALAYSLSKGKRFSLSELKDAKGKEYSGKVLFGENLAVYVALICEHYGVHRSDQRIPKFIKMHIDDGLEMMNAELKKNPNIDGFDYILAKIDNGLQYL